MAGTVSSRYQSVEDRAGWFDRSGRSRLRIGGPDRAKFLHNLTTNDVKRLADGSGHESFVTSPQGKVLAYITVLAIEDATLLVRTDPGSIESLLAHLQKYGVFDEITIDDDSAETFESHLAGPSAGAILTSLGIELPPEGDLRHRSAELAGVAVRLVRESPSGRPGLTLIGPVAGAVSVKAKLAGLGIAEIDDPNFEALRIEAGTPISGLDVTPSHLPQEVGRDKQAINFVKGCYLGQETVARLDALGHVNRIFKGLRFAGPTVPPLGTSLSFEGKVVGSVTSAAFSSGWGAPIGLGYVRVAQAASGTKLAATIEGVGEVEAIVEDLPMRPGQVDPAAAPR